MSNATLNRKRRNDIIFILVLVLVVAATGLCYFLIRDEGNTVTVTVDGETYGVYSLFEDRVEDIHTGDSELNRLVIKDGKAYMETATCPDGICAGHRPIFREGDSIVCLPHRVVVTVHTDDAVQPDIVV